MLIPVSGVARDEQGEYHALGATHERAPNDPQNKRLWDNFYFLE